MVVIKLNSTKNEMIYQKLFDINYNNKVYTIFIDQYGRKTFLEKHITGKYLYPQINDFIILHKIYNERNSFISSDSNTLPIGYRLPNRRKVKFQEFVRDSIGEIAFSMAILAGATLISGMIMGRTFKLVKEDDEIKIVVDYVDGALIKSTDELDDILGYKSVTVEQIEAAINLNDGIDVNYKQPAINLIRFIKNKYPNTDSRIYYENMKGVSVVEVEKSKMQKNVAGTYNSYSNVVSIRDDHTDSEEVITHEYAHAYHHWKQDTPLSPKYRDESLGYSLDEAMTNKIISGLVEPTSYEREIKFLDYFLTCVDYNYYDYEKEGISKLIDLLQKKYSTIDISYIIHSIDAMKETYSNLDQYIKIEENLDLLDELFNICISNVKINSNDIYQPFINFIKLINLDDYPDLANNYLADYNKFLIENGFDKDKINNNIGDFVRLVSIYSAEEESFKRYVKELDISEIPKDDIYQPFKKFFIWGGSEHNNYISKEEINNHFYNMLEIYNDFLYRNGYTGEQTISREVMQTKIDKYKGIKVIGYGITTDDILTPIIDIPNIDKVYNTETKVPILNRDGRITLLDKTDLRETHFEEDGVYQYNFIMTIFKRLDEEKIDFNEEYWQDQFIIYNSEYKKIDFLLNGEKIAEDYLYDVNITVGQKTDGTNTFSLKSDSQIILQDESTLNEETISFVEYLGDDPYKNINMTSIEIGKYLNKDYLRKAISGEKLSSPINTRYAIFTYDKENDIVNVHPPYYINVAEDGRMPMNYIFLELEPGRAYTWIYGYLENVSEFIYTDIEIPYVKIYLETVLDYYGILSNDQVEYSFSKSEILELYNKYVQDVYSNKLLEERENINTISMSK